VVCSKAQHLVDDPLRTVDDLHRVLRPCGAAIVTVPHLFIAEGDFERHWSPADLRGLFDRRWDVEVRGVDGPGVALAFIVGRLAMLAARRWHVPAPIFRRCMVLMNTASEALDLLLSPLHRRWPHSLVLVARRRPHHSASG
jgi:hypothetical protein